jgi:Domain of unknown function (DUF4833)
MLESRVVIVLKVIIFFMPSMLLAADAILFKDQDIATVFFINKSDDRNRVDYGIHLDQNCHPTSKDEAVFFYWREFEKSPPVRTHDTNFWDEIAYGIKEQRLLSQNETGAEYFVRLKQIDRDITIIITRSGKDICTAIAKMTINHIPNAQLLSAFAKLGGGLFSVEYVDIHGKDLKTGKMIEDRILR